MICGMSSPIVSDRQVVCTATTSGLYTVNIVSSAASRLACPPKTLEPSVKLLVAA